MCDANVFVFCVVITTVYQVVGELEAHCSQFFSTGHPQSGQSGQQRHDFSGTPYLRSDYRVIERQCQQIRCMMDVALTIKNKKG